MSQRYPVIPGYEILAEVARNGLEEYYKAKDTHLNRLVMLKLLAHGTQAAVHQKEIVLWEARVNAGLAHPNILALYRVSETDGRLCLTFEYVEGPRLANRLVGAPQYPRPAARLLRTLARAAHYVHERGFIHRDLKPANILLAPDPEGRSEFGIPKLTDFELALGLNDQGSFGELGEAIVGTPAYMAPEQVLGRRSDIGPATDVYGLGVILYEMLTGQHPFRASSVLELVKQKLDREPPPLRATQPQVPVELEAICLKCLQKELSRRYPTAAALAEALEWFLAGSS
jgi:serine/threonine-protein kinase